MSNFIFTCPHCKNEMEAENGMLGKTATCPFCEQQILIKKPPQKQSPIAEKAVNSQQQNAKNSFKQICSNCGEILTYCINQRGEIIDAENNIIGKTVTCPFCEQQILIKKPSQKQSPIAEKAVNSQQQNAKNSFKQICSNCGETLTCYEHQRGQTIVCPSCDEQISVPGKKSDICIPAVLMIVWGFLHILGGIFAMLMHPALLAGVLLSIPAFLTAWVFQKLYESNELQKKQIDLQNKQLELLQELLKK